MEAEKANFLNKLFQVEVILVEFECDVRTVYVEVSAIECALCPRPRGSRPTLNFRLSFASFLLNGLFQWCPSKFSS